MKTKNFNSKAAYWFGRNQLLMPGLDITQKHIPDDFQPEMKTINPEKRHKEFIQFFADLTAPYCLGWKPNLKFYEGSIGRTRLEEVCAYISKKYPDHIMLGDNKDGDIGNTNEQALNYYVNTLKLDAITLNPLMGYADSMEIFLSNPNIGGFLLCLTSNKGSLDILRGEFAAPGVPHAKKLFEYIASFAKAGNNWNCGNVHLVVGATNTVAEVESIRELAGDDAIFLMPGFGAQGGNPEVLNAARNKAGNGFFGVVARDLISPKLNDGEKYADGVVRMAKFYQNLFSGTSVNA